VRSVIRKILLLSNRKRCSVCNSRKFNYLYTQTKIPKADIGRTITPIPLFQIDLFGTGDIRSVGRLNKIQQVVDGMSFTKVCAGCGKMTVNLCPNNPALKHD
jgi:hypothetical protein